MKTATKSRFVARTSVLVSAISAAAGSAWAQTPVNGPLSTLPGLTAVQQPTANAIMTLCPQLGPAGIAVNRNGTPAERLNFTCTSMVVTAIELQTGQSPAPQLSLKISNPELRQAVQDIAPVQMGAQKQISTETARMNVIGARLLDLRSGSQGVTVSSNGGDPVTGRSGNTRTAALSGARGGGAAADAPIGGPLGGFINVGTSWGNADRTDLQDPYDYRNYTIVGGLDYRVSPAMVLGVALSYSDTKSDFDQGLGDIKSRTASVAGYGTFYVDQWYVEAFLGYGGVDYDTKRNINIPSNNPAVAPLRATATAGPKGHEWSASVGIGRNFPFGTATMAPSARLTYVKVRNKAFTEDEPTLGLGLSVQDRSVKSLQTSLGARASTVVSSGMGVFTPYASAHWVHEFKNDQASIVSKYVNDPFNTTFAIPTQNPTRNYAVVGLGTTATLPNNVAAFAQLSAALGLRDQTNYGVVLGVRKQF